jgi:hypothetical protein
MAAIKRVRRLAASFVVLAWIVTAVLARPHPPSTAEGRRLLLNCTLRQTLMQSTLTCTINDPVLGVAALTCSLVGGGGGQYDMHYD